MPSGGTWQTDLGQAGAHGRLAGDEGGASGRTTLLAVPIREDRAFPGDAVDVGRPVTHHAHVVGADVELANVFAPNDENIGGFLLSPQSVGSAGLQFRNRIIMKS